MARQAGVAPTAENWIVFRGLIFIKVFIKCWVMCQTNVIRKLNQMVGQDRYCLSLVGFSSGTGNRPSTTEHKLSLWDVLCAWRKRIGRPEQWAGKGVSLELGRPHRAGALKAGINHAQSGGEVWFLAERVPGKQVLHFRSSLKSLRLERIEQIGERAKAAWLTCSD